MEKKKKKKNFKQFQRLALSDITRMSPAEFSGGEFQVGGQFFMLACCSPSNKTLF
jgi:hypothetical protein